MHACQAGVHGLGILFSRKKQIPPLTALLNLNADLGNDVMSMALSKSCFSILSLHIFYLKFTNVD